MAKKRENNKLALSGKFNGEIWLFPNEKQKQQKQFPNYCLAFGLLPYIAPSLCHGPFLSELSSSVTGGSPSFNTLWIFKTLFCNNYRLSGSCIRSCIHFTNQSLYFKIKLFFKVIFWSRRKACRILGSSPGTEPAPPSVEAQSLNHWTTRSNLKGKFQMVRKSSFNHRPRIHPCKKNVFQRAEGNFCLQGLSNSLA